jgi:nitroreductase/FMN reductase [NAD(P)H]
MSEHTDPARPGLTELLSLRFGEISNVPARFERDPILLEMVGHRTVRAYLDQAIAPEILRLVCASALSAPSKSDLQQADIIVVSDPELRRAIAALIPEMPWIGRAPAFLVVCGNNRRQRAIADLHAEPFPNDHLDPFFNATVDAGLVLAQLLRAAGAVGLGTCPISVIRDHAERLSELLELPEFVFPVAGLCLGYPAEERSISPRLDLALTLHEDHYDESRWRENLEAYDTRREALHRTWGQQGYRWSKAKAKQYSTPQRADFGAFVRGKGFRLE